MQVELLTSYISSMWISKRNNARTSKPQSIHDLSKGLIIISKRCSCKCDFVVPHLMSLPFKTKGPGPRAIQELFCRSSFNQQNLEQSLGSKEPSPEFHSTWLTNDCQSSFDYASFGTQERPGSSWTFSFCRHLHLDSIACPLLHHSFAWAKQVATTKRSTEGPSAENQVSTTRVVQRGWCQLPSAFDSYTSTRTEANTGGAGIHVWLLRWRWLRDNGIRNRSFLSPGCSKCKKRSYSAKVSPCIRWWCLCTWPAHWVFRNDSEVASGRQVCIFCCWPDGIGAVNEAGPAWSCGFRHCWSCAPLQSSGKFADYETKRLYPYKSSCHLAVLCRLFRCWRMHWCGHTFR